MENSPSTALLGSTEHSEKAGSVLRRERSTGSPGPAAHRALTLLLKFLKTYQKQKAEQETGPSGSRSVVVKGIGSSNPGLGEDYMQ